MELDPKGEAHPVHPTGKYLGFGTHSHFLVRSRMAICFMSEPSSLLPSVTCPRKQQDHSKSAVKASLPVFLTCNASGCIQNQLV